VQPAPLYDDDARRRPRLQPAPRSTGFQLSVAAVFGILLPREPLNTLVEGTLLRPFIEPPRAVSNLISVSLAAQVSTAPIVAATFDEVSTIGVLTNLIAVPISGPILTLGLLGSLQRLPRHPPQNGRPVRLLAALRHLDDPGRDAAPRRPLLRRVRPHRGRRTDVPPGDASRVGSPPAPVDDALAGPRRLWKHLEKPEDTAFTLPFSICPRPSPRCALQ
jgi:hypothetical protein